MSKHRTISTDPARWITEYVSKPAGRLRIGHRDQRFCCKSAQNLSHCSGILYVRYLRLLSHLVWRQKTFKGYVVHLEGYNGASCWLPTTYSGRFVREIIQISATGTNYGNGTSLLLQRRVRLRPTSLDVTPVYVIDSIVLGKLFVYYTRACNIFV